MVKHPKRRTNKNFGVVTFRNASALGTLADNTLQTATMTALAQDFYCASVDCLWAIRDATITDGPITCGFANGDLSSTEITEALDANPTSQSDIIAIERTRRPVRYAGQFDLAETDTVLNDGRRMRTKLKIMLNEGVELVAWVRNESGKSLETGAVLEISGKIYGNWK